MENRHIVMLHPLILEKMGSFGNEILLSTQNGKHAVVIYRLMVGKTLGKQGGL